MTSKIWSLLKDQLFLLYSSLLKANLTDLMILILFSFENFQCYRNISKNRIKNDHVSLHPDFSHPNTFLFPSLPSSLFFLHLSFPPSLSYQIWNHMLNLVFHLISLTSNSSLGLSLFFLTLKLFWEIQVSYCVECPSIRVYLLFPHDYISSAYEFLQKNHRSNVFISVHHNRGHLVDLSRDCLPGFSTTNLFSLSS